MKLPNADAAFVEEEKVRGYLLNSEHRYGASKAKFFEEFGFTLQDWEMLANALHERGQQHDVSKEKQTGFGPRNEVVGELTTPDGRRPCVRTVWQVDKGETAPRLITAHSLEDLA